MKIYIDSDYRCHTTKSENACREFDVTFFDGKCTTFIEGFYYIPPGESSTSSGGVVLDGERIAPWKDYSELDAAQREYERQKLADAENALAILLGGAV